MLYSKGQSLIVNARFLTQPVTGVQRFAIEISLRLKKLIPGVVFISPKNILHKEIAAVLQVEEFGKFTSHLWEQVELPLYLKKRGSPLLLNLSNTAPLLHTKNVVCIHDVSFLVNPEWFSKTFSSFYSFLIPKVARGAKKVLTVSEYSKESLVNFLRIPEAAVEVVYNAVSEDLFNNTEPAQPNKVGDYVLAVGSLDPRKNLKKLILAFNTCKLADTKLVIAGAASKIFNDDELQHLVHSNENIVLTGYLTDEELKHVYQHAKLFVYPSLFEGFGIPPLEAMRCGCATVVSDAASLPEVCGDASYYVDPHSMEEIATAITQLMGDNDLRSSLIRKGFERSKFFSWEKSSEKLVQVLEALK